MPRNQMRNEIQIFILALLFRQVILFLIAYFFIWKTWGLRYIIINKRLTALWFYDFKDFAQVMLPQVCFTEHWYDRSFMGIKKIGFCG